MKSNHSRLCLWPLNQLLCPVAKLSDLDKKSISAKVRLHFYFTNTRMNCFPELDASSSLLLFGIRLDTIQDVQTAADRLSKLFDVSAVKWDAPHLRRKCYWREFLKV